MTDLLSTQQISARARARREHLSRHHTDDGASEWPIIVEGWSGDRQAFGLGVRTTADLVGTVLLARSALNVDKVVVFSDSRMFSPDLTDRGDREIFDRYGRGEVTLADLSAQGHPRVIEAVFTMVFDKDRGILETNAMRYLTSYFRGRETGVIWDDDAPMLTDPLHGNTPAALTMAMQTTGLAKGSKQFQVADGGRLMWEDLDADDLREVVRVLGLATKGRFIILNADPKITAAAGLKPGSAPGRVAAGSREPEVLRQLLAREV